MNIFSPYYFDFKHIEKLQGWDLYSIDTANEVVQDVLNNPRLFHDLFKGRLGTDSIIRAREVDAIEKISKINGKCIQNYKSEIIYEIAQKQKQKQKEVPWHVVQLISYLKLDSKKRNNSFALLLYWLDDSQEKSKIVKVFCIQALTDLAIGDKNLEQRIISKL